MKKIVRAFLVSFAVVFCILFIIKFEICKNAVLKGLLICSNVIIPSLFPFTVCLLFIINTSIFANLKVMGVLGKVFCFNAEEFCVFFFALLGGYPTGAKMLNELYENGRISKDKATLMLNCCINAGPAFIISAVGTGVFNSKTVGTVLFLSHIMASLVLALFISREYDKNNQTQQKLKRVSLTDAFINSTAQASSAVMSICFYVILFCVITSYINFYSESFNFIKFLSCFLEVTVGVQATKNIYLISFLLGFSGLCVWMQVFTVAKSIKPPFLLFSIFRVLHGTLSVVFTYIILKLFKIDNNVIANNVSFTQKTFYSSTAVGLALLILAVFFILCVNSKKISGNLSEDLL